MVKLTQLHPANLGLTPTTTHESLVEAGMASGQNFSRAHVRALNYIQYGRIRTDVRGTAGDNENVNAKRKSHKICTYQQVHQHED